MKFKINSTESLSRVIGEIRQLFKSLKYLELNIVEQGKKRSLPQNALQHVWYGKVADEEREYDPSGVKCLCKYHFGLPILRAETDKEGDLTPQAIKINWMIENVLTVIPYEDQIKAIEFLPVTSLMTTKQLNTYLEHVQAHFVGRVELLFPDDK